jgi:hypothetical protein
LISKPDEMKTIAVVTFIILLLSFFSCAPIETIASHDFASGFYKLKTKDQEKPQKVYADLQKDTINVYGINNTGGHKSPGSEPLKIIALNETGLGTKFVRTSVDADLSTILTKLRLSQERVPTQLNANLNAALYVGIRRDLFILKSHKDFMSRSDSFIRQIGFDAGLFAGLGITQVTPTTTDFHTLQEYDGVVFQKGLAVFFTFEKMSVGLCLGFDNLMDGNSNIWVYNQKPYIGLVLGIANF